MPKNGYTLDKCFRNTYFFTFIPKLIAMQKQKPLDNNPNASQLVLEIEACLHLPVSGCFSKIGLPVLHKSESGCRL